MYYLRMSLAGSVYFMKENDVWSIYYKDRKFYQTKEAAQKVLEKQKRKIIEIYGEKGAKPIIKQMYLGIA